jgi:hypothetical protein
VGNEKAGVAKALQTVVDMITDVEPDGTMAARVAMILEMIEARVGRDTYYGMLQELSRFVAFRIMEIELTETHGMLERLVWAAWSE